VSQALKQLGEETKRNVANLDLSLKEVERDEDLLALDKTIQGNDQLRSDKSQFLKDRNDVIRRARTCVSTATDDQAYASSRSKDLKALIAEYRSKVNKIQASTGRVAKTQAEQARMAAAAKELEGKKTELAAGLERLDKTWKAIECNPAAADQKAAAYASCTAGLEKIAKQKAAVKKVLEDAKKTQKLFREHDLKNPETLKLVQAMFPGLEVDEVIAESALPLMAKKARILQGDIDSYEQATITYDRLDSAIRTQIQLASDATTASKNKKNAAIAEGNARVREMEAIVANLKLDQQRIETDLAMQVARDSQDDESIKKVNESIAALEGQSKTLESQSSEAVAKRMECFRIVSSTYAVTFEKRDQLKDLIVSMTKIEGQTVAQGSTPASTSR
jgi:DNA repair exonuclease SbcCD ATPase subunit